jgi:hypothetical protein
MPIMIRHNAATECCITKGAEGTVVSWQASVGPHGKPVLNTLFVKLVNPPQDIYITGLQKNIVPITKISQDIVCTLMNGKKVSITRNQVPVLLNFSMTDYASQGRTRPDNVVDLQNCRTHMSYYTALSRSATAEGTIIVQGFDPAKITGGAPGYLRQEFRELELLDQITKLRHEGHLPLHIEGHRRNTLIRQFQQWKGTHHVPDVVHPALKWSSSDQFDLLPVMTDTAWQIILNQKKYNAKPSQMINKHAKIDLHNTNLVFIPAKGSKRIVEEESMVNTEHMCKRKAEPDSRGLNKKPRLIPQIDNGDLSSIPIGLVWDEKNWSCCYDSLFTILYSVWICNPKRWTRSFRRMNRVSKKMVSGFRKLANNNTTFETVRNEVRMILHQLNQNNFAYGAVGTSMPELTNVVATTEYEAETTYITCNQCGFENIHRSTAHYTILPLGALSTTEGLQKHCDNIAPYPCTGCGNCDMTLSREFGEQPELLMFVIGGNDIVINHTVPSPSKKACNIHLRGIIYLGGYHFTARIFDLNGKVWFHDGRTYGNTCVPQGWLADFDAKSLCLCGSRKAVLAVYARS